jgi:hypothetical protein
MLLRFAERHEPERAGEALHRGDEIGIADVHVRARRDLELGEARHVLPDGPHVRAVLRARLHVDGQSFPPTLFQLETRPLKMSQICASVRLRTPVFGLTTNATGTRANSV